MVSDKALYWMAVIVMALGLGNSFVNAHPEWAQSVAERPVMLADRVSSRATSLVSLAEMMFGRSEVGVARTQTAMARVQCRLASAQSRVAARQAQIARIQAERVRSFTRAQVDRVVVICTPQDQDTEQNAPDAPVVPNDDPN